MLFSSSIACKQLEVVLFIISFMRSIQYTHQNKLMLFTANSIQKNFLHNNNNVATVVFTFVAHSSLVCTHFVVLTVILFDLDKWFYIFVWQTDKMQYYKNSMVWQETGQRILSIFCINFFYSFHIFGRIHCRQCFFLNFKQIFLEYIVDDEQREQDFKQCFLFQF